MPLNIAGTSALRSMCQQCLSEVATEEALPFLLAEAVVFCDVLSSLDGYVYDVAELVEEAVFADALRSCAVE